MMHSEICWHDGEVISLFIFIIIIKGILIIENFRLCQIERKVCWLDFEFKKFWSVVEKREHENWNDVKSCAPAV